MAAVLTLPREGVIVFFFFFNVTSSYAREIRRLADQLSEVSARLPGRAALRALVLDAAKPKD